MLIACILIAHYSHLGVENKAKFLLFISLLKKINVLREAHETMKVESVRDKYKCLGVEFLIVRI